MTSPQSDPPRLPSGGRPLWPLAALGAAVLVVTFGGYEALERLVLASRLDLKTLHLLHIVRGIGSAVALAALVAWYLLRGGVPAFLSRRPPATAPVLDRELRTRQHAHWFVHMRWIAAGTSLPSIYTARATRLLPDETLPVLLGWWVVLVLANVGFRRWAQHGERPDRQIVVQVIVDLAILTGLLNASGGIENPLYLAYLFHVMIAGILLPRGTALGLTAVASGLFLVLALGEYFHVLPHHTIVLFPHGSLDEAGGLDAATAHGSYDLLFVGGRVFPFVGVLVLSAYLTTLVMDRLRESEREFEEAVWESLLEHQRLESLVHSAGVGMLVMAPDLTLQWFSRRAGEWLGWTPDAVGQRCQLLEPAAGCAECLAARTLQTGQPLEGERSVTTPGGGVRHFRHATSPVRDAEGRIAQVVELVEEVTARKALEAEAIHAGKLAVLGRLAAGIAHEIGNPLSSLATRLELMERRREPEFLSESLKLLRGQIDRMTRIVHGVSQFARPRRHEWTTWDVNTAVEEAVSMVSLDRRARHIAFRKRLAGAPLRVRGVKDEMVQVFLNLLLNAIEAMPDGGTAHVQTFYWNGKVGIAVSDTGRGMTEEVRARLFEPFFSTKPDGTGLGLSICYSLVHAHGGHIEVTSAPGEGSRFVAWLPGAGADTAVVQAASEEV